jgi:arylsulfatase A-like enzyme
LISVADALRAGRSVDTLSKLAWLALCAAAGLLLAAAAYALHYGCVSAASRRPRIAVPLAVGLVCGLLCLPLGSALFSGPAMVRAGLQHVGPPVFALIAGAFAGVFHQLFQRWALGGVRTRRLAAGSLAALSLGALICDRYVLVGLYAYAHVVVALAGMGLLGLSLALLRPPHARHAAQGALAMLVSGVALVPVTTAFPHDDRTRGALVEYRPVAAHVMSALTYAVDFDRDGASSLFTAGDCDDFDPRIHPLALDVPGNRVDEDCDGEDADAASQRDVYGGDRSVAERLSAAAAGRPTVVIVIDALRDDRVGDPRFPNLARLARQSIRFDRAYAASASTAMSVPAMLSGRQLPRAGDATLFERLARHGRSTAIVAPEVIFSTVDGSNHTPSSIAFPLRNRAAITHVVPSDKTWKGDITAPSDALVTDAALRILDAEKVALLWAHYFDLHQWRYLDDVSEDGVARYDAVLARADIQIGRWLERADTLNLVLTSDHGEGLGEHDVLTHTLYLWRPIARVPLLLRIPGVAPLNVPSPVTLEDLTPTLLDLLGHAGPAARGFSLLGLPGVVDARPSFAAIERRQLALVAGRYRLIFDAASRASWLYDVMADPAERENLAEREPERVEAMRRRLLALTAAASARLLAPAK